MAIIFDMDGVLIDSEPLWKLAEVEIFRTVGVPLTIEMCSETTGMRMDAAVDHWFERYPWSGTPRRQVARAVVERVSALISDEGRAMPGAARLVQDLHAGGALLGLCSSSPMRLIRAVCERLELTTCFAVLQTAEDCERGKPFPDPYLRTAERLGVAPADCLVFEDSRTGILSAHSAGMTVVGVGDSAAGSEHCTRTLPDLERVEPATVIQWLPTGG